MRTAFQNRGKGGARVVEADISISDISISDISISDIIFLCKSFNEKYVPEHSYESEAGEIDDDLDAPAVHTAYKCR